MNSEDLFIAALALVPAVIAGLLTATGYGKFSAGLLAILLLAALVFGLRSNNMSGYDGLGTFLIAVACGIAAAGVGVGMFVGGLIRRSRQR